MLEKTKGHSNLQATADLTSLARFALEQQTVPAPFGEIVHDRFAPWHSSQVAAGSIFTPEQRRWLTTARDDIAGSLTVETDDFQCTIHATR